MVKNTNDVFNAELLRIILTYFISLFICISLVMGNYDGNYKDSLFKVIIITFLYLIICGIFDYVWIMMKY